VGDMSPRIYCFVGSKVVVLKKINWAGVSRCPGRGGVVSKKLVVTGSSPSLHIRLSLLAILAHWHLHALVHGHAIRIGVLI